MDNAAIDNHRWLRYRQQSTLHFNDIWHVRIIAAIDRFDRSIGSIDLIDLIDSIVLATLAPNMHNTKCRGARDTYVVKISALYDPWRSKRQRKIKNLDFLAFEIDFKNQAKICLIVQKSCKAFA